MKIKSVRLENIRSYVNEVVEFPEKIVLLSGDVGSGKSSILLAVEFALFGPQRGGGDILLRKGTEGGCVELNCEIDDNDVVIRRILKKTNDNIVQESGILSINGNIENLSVTELKQRVLQMLNYPPEMLTKKSLIYRYTVYTPQEEMKMILLGEPDLRLDTLRKVFDIDKYKRIRDNARYVIAALKIKCRDFEEKVKGINDDQLKLNEHNLKLNDLQNELNNVDSDFKILKEKIKIKNLELEAFDENVKKFNELNKTIELVKQNLKNKEVIFEKTKEKIDAAGDFSEFEDVVEKIKIALDKKKILEEALKKISNDINSVHVKKKACDDIKNKICGLDICPLCKQNVVAEHKQNISSEQDEVINVLDKDLQKFVIDETRFKDELNLIDVELDELRKQDKQNETIKLKKQMKEKLVEEVQILEVDLEKLRFDLERLNEELSGYKVEDNSVLKNELNLLLEQEKEFMIKKVSKEKEIEFMDIEIKRLQNALQEKLRFKELFEKYSILNRKISDEFIKAMELMEKNVMLAVYNSFNSLFEKWFTLLMNDDLIKVKLDEEFVPLIEQNGYNISYENLSGGEKTACALAYRLALNQVINNIVSSVKTRDLIILDEPTDGFSSEQLDRMRLVLNELDMKQVIVVSHESKVESFVDHVIKIEKQGHVSRVI